MTSSKETKKINKQDLEQKSKSTSKIEKQQVKFGTLGGVFTPCTLTILGVIMFLRYGQVVGQSGLVNALIILFIAKMITTLTASSLSAIATNTRVKGGGAYYLISRSLGVELGGAIGIFFFLAQAISVAMYVIGFTEAFLDIIPQEVSQNLAFIGGDAFPFWLETIVNIIVFICVFIGAGWTIKVQYFILAILGLSLVSFFFGAMRTFSIANMYSNFQPSYQGSDNFYTMFALFFPAVTGIMAGANMSGDLKQPEKSIPKGTLSAILVTGIVYFFMAVFLAGACSKDMLLNDPMIVKNISYFQILVILGVFAATLSSALGSMMGAPRILQAFARDEIFQSLKIFAQGSGANNEPRRAIILTFIIAQLGILLGDLNAIAPIITMFFMITYGMLNLSTFYESITKNPSYRPTFKYSHWTTELLGALGCGVVMFLISPLWATVSILAMGALQWFIARKEVEARWGDVQSGITFEKARKNLLKLQDERYYHPKNWRPIILALSGGVWNKVYLAVYGHWLTAGHGVLSLGQVIVGNVDDLAKRRISQEQILKKFIREKEIDAFPAIMVGSDLIESIKALIQCHGLGGFQPNTILLGWNNEEDKENEFCDLLRTLQVLNKSIIVLRTDAEKFNQWQTPTGSIDVWWRGRENGELMLILAHLLQKNNLWRTHRIRLLRIISSEAGLDDATNHLNELIKLSRIKATASVIVANDVNAAMRMTSSRSAVVFLGLTPPKEESEQEAMENMKKLSGNFSTTIFVSSAGGIQIDV